MRVLLAGLMLVGLAACGNVHPERGNGAAAVPATSGGLNGPQEGNPGNAHDLGGTPNSTTLGK